jgi:hypothetical protein
MAMTRQVLLGRVGKSLSRTAMSVFASPKVVRRNEDTQKSSKAGSVAQKVPTCSRRGHFFKPWPKYHGSECRRSSC